MYRDPDSFIATLSSKGQLVIPKPLREAIGLEVGSKVTLEPTKDGTLTLKATAENVDKLFSIVETDPSKLEDNKLIEQNIIEHDKRSR